MNIKITALLIALLMTAAIFASCDTSSSQTTAPEKTRQVITDGQNDTPATTDTASSDDTSPVGGELVSEIKLNGSDATCGEGAEYKDKIITVSKAGTYNISGKLDDGQIVVNVTKEERVTLVLNGVDITCKTSCPIWIQHADKVTVNVMPGTENTLSDTSSYVGVTDEPNACIFANDDLTLKGSGKLTVNGNYKNGISGKNDIRIKELDLTVNAYNTGIRGKDSVEIESGTISITASKDGIKSSNDTEVGRGYIQIIGGDITIDAGDDALQAVTEIIVKDCSIKAVAQGKITNCKGTVSIAEGCLNSK